jgi:hypothetical protein
LFGKLHEHVVRGSSGAPESQWEAARERDEEFPRGDVAVGRASWDPEAVLLVVRDAEGGVDESALALNPPDQVRRLPRDARGVGGRGGAW